MNSTPSIPWKKALALVGGLTLCYSAAAAVVSLTQPSISYPSEQTAELPTNMPVPTDSDLTARPLRTLWFGHSLMEYGAAPDENVPAINIPKMVDEIHALARKDGRTERPDGLTVSHYDGPKDLVYWLQGGGGATRKLKDFDEPWDYVIGVGFMHLTLQKGGKHAFRSNKLEVPTSVDHLKGATRDLVDVFTFGKLYQKTVNWITLNKYRFIKATNELDPQSTWLNYVGPVLSDRPSNQASVDARFACMLDVAEQAGARAGNVPVGASVRRAEVALRSAGLRIPLQRKDRLHYTAEGAFLAASVFYAYLYDVDPTGLPAPASLSKYFEGAEGKTVRILLQKVAWSTTREAKRGHLAPCKNARLPVDDEGLRILKQ